MADAKKFPLNVIETFPESCENFDRMLPIVKTIDRNVGAKRLRTTEDFLEFWTVQQQRPDPRSHSSTDLFGRRVAGENRPSKFTDDSRDISETVPQRRVVATRESLVDESQGGRFASERQAYRLRSEQENIRFDGIGQFRVGPWDV
uniref:Uncharacterized protein n=1 Tax=Rhodopseudomonas palustris (strain BisA53) TaxID=316055 RepID=Q07LK2_RHOP5